jgi:molybdopterin molybdotransferase
MTSFEEARDLILSNVTPMDTEQVDLLDSLGRVASETVIAQYNLPSFDNSAMDGYAVRVADSSTLASLPISGYIPAGGTATDELAPGSAIKIMTGAPVPQGADAIVPFEEATETGQVVRIESSPHPGQHIRHAGEDVKIGETVLPAGTLIRVPEICILAAQGRSSIQVYRKPLVAILATGDELVEIGSSLPEGKVFNSNSPTLAAAVLEVGATYKMIGIARDDREHLRQMVALGLQADVLITAAGVSVGDRDFVREILEELGVKQLLWKVKMKPGKSIAFGTNRGKPVFALPGNPVSAIVTFEELVRPALLKMMGHRCVIKPLVTAILQEEMRKTPGRVFLSRVRLVQRDGKYLAWSAGNQDTGRLQTMLQANALAILPADRASFAAGEEIKVHLLSNVPVL